MEKRFKVTSMTRCGTPYTVGRASTYLGAKKMAYQASKINRRTCQILDGKRRVQ